MSRAREFADLAGSADAGGLTGRNLVINGAMQVAQRGTSHTGFQNNGNYTLDRFAYRRSGTISSTTFDVTQENTSGLPEFPKCIQIQVKDAAMSDPNTPNSARNEIKYTFEGQDLQHLQYGTATAQAVTVSFYVKSSVAGTYSWYWNAVDSEDSYIAEYTISSADTWEYKTITVPAPTTSQVDTAIANDNTVGVNMGWTGYGNVTGTSDHRTSTTGWQAAPSGTQPIYTDNQANAFSTLDNTFSLTGVQLEVGEQATPFEHRPFGDELALCRRYFEKSYDVGTAPGTSDYNGSENWSLNSDGNANTIFRPSISVEKRAAPTMVAYRATGTSGSWNYERSGTSGTGTVTFDRKGTNGCRAYLPVGANWVSTYIFGHWTADAEL